MIDWPQKLRDAATAPKRADCMSIEDANLWITVLLNEIDRLREELGSYPEELTSDQVAFLHEQAAQRRRLWEKDITHAVHNC